VLFNDVGSRASRAAADATGSERFLDVSSHDLRRFRANYLLVNEGVNPRVIMSLGGWEDFQSIKPYLDRPRDSTVAEEIETAGWV
jgi:integrase